MTDRSFFGQTAIVGIGHSDYHPAAGRAMGHGLNIPSVDPPSSILGGEAFLARIYDAYKKPLGLRDFGHDAQDAIAIQLLRETHALPLVLSGNVADAIHAASSRWASFPGAGYNQHENQMDVLVKAFVRFGGVLAS